MSQKTVFSSNTVEIANMDNMLDDDSLTFPIKTFFDNNLINKNTYADIVQNYNSSNDEKNIYQDVQKISNFTEYIKDKDELIKNNDTYLKETIKSTKETNKKIKSIIEEKKIIKNYNMNRKLRNLLIKYSVKYINNTIRKVYNNKIGNGINEKKLCKISYSDIQKMDKSFEGFLNVTFKEIFSLDISKKHTYLPPDFNKKVIESLLREKNEEKRELFNNIFNQTFREWIQYLLKEKDEFKALFEEELKDEELFKYIIKKLEP